MEERFNLNWVTWRNNVKKIDFTTPKCNINYDRKNQAHQLAFAEITKQIALFLTTNLLFVMLSKVIEHPQPVYSPSTFAWLLPEGVEGVKFTGDGVIAGVEGGAEESSAQVVATTTRQILRTNNEIGWLQIYWLVT